MNTAKIGNYSSEHRLACEARHVMRLNHIKRMEHYGKILPLRGRASVDALIAEVNRQYRISQEQTAEMGG